MSDEKTGFEEVTEGFKDRWPFGVIESPGKRVKEPAKVGSAAALNQGDWQFSYDPSSKAWSAPGLPGYTFKTASEVSNWVETVMKGASPVDRYQWSRKFGAGVFAPGMERFMGMGSAPAAPQVPAPRGPVPMVGPSTVSKNPLLDG